MAKPIISAASSSSFMGGGEGRDIVMISNKNNNDTEEAKYRGVRKRKWGKWVSEIRLPNSRERIWLGSYDSPEKAARAFDAALFCLRGHNANFNFPHQPPNIPGGTDLHPSQIQAAAAHYANTFSSSSSSSRDHQLHDHHHPSVSMPTTASTSMDVVLSSSSSSSCSFLTDHHDHNINVIHDNSTNNIPDFGIFPGFDDYFMPRLQPSYSTAHEYSTTTEEVYDYGVCSSQDPCHLWNF